MKTSNELKNQALHPVVILGMLVALVGSSPAWAQEELDFTGLTPGDSVTAPGKLHPSLKIGSERDTTGDGLPDTPSDVVYLKEGVGLLNTYGSAGLSNGCIGDDSLGNPTATSGNGFGDVSAKIARERHFYNFMFSTDGFQQIATVDQFSITMYDTGDFNPNLIPNHLYELIGFDVAGQIVDVDSNMFWSTSMNVPTTIRVPDNLAPDRDGVKAGDACLAENADDPGRRTLSIFGDGIVRVELRQETDSDPNWGLGNVRFSLEECVCEGQVDALTLQYLGPDGVTIQVESKGGIQDAVNQDGSTTFSKFDTFEFVDPIYNRLGPKIFLHVGNTKTEIHTSCSQPIGPGTTVGDFMVVKGSSRVGGRLCPPDDDDSDSDSDSDCSAPTSSLLTSIFGVLQPAVAKN